MLYPEFDELISYKNLKLERSRSFSPSKSIQGGMQYSRFRGQGLEFDSVRQYVPGDDIRNIDWRVTARIGSPHLKIFQEEKLRHIVLCVDMNSSMMFGTKNTFKSIQAARIASILGWQAISHDDIVSACLFGNVPSGLEFINTKNKKSSFSQILRRFCLPSDNHYRTPLVDVLKNVCEHMKSGSVLYLISDFMDLGNEELDDWLKRIKKKCDIVFISINDPAEKTLVSIGNLCVSDRSEKLLINTDNKSFRETYEAQWKENRKNLYQKAQEFKIRLIEFTTEDEIKNDFIPTLKGLSKRAIDE